MKDAILFETFLQIYNATDVQSNRIQRKIEKRQMIQDRLKSVMYDDGNSLTVCVDLSWASSMNEKVVALLVYGHAVLHKKLKLLVVSPSICACKFM